MFKKEKERVRSIMAKIGGVPTFNTKTFNIIFATLVLICLAISLISGGVLRLAMIELAIAALSVKLIYLMHNQACVNHFQLWILLSLKWRPNEIIRAIKADRN